MQRRMSDPLCRCGHPFVSHEHLRHGTECAWCAPGSCERYRPPTLLHRLGARLGHGDSRTSGTLPSLVLVR